jgi:peptidylprolyl isomerase
MSANEKPQKAVPGRVVEVHYVGVSWSSGEQFDASWDRGDTFKFTLGKGKVIQGWDEGVAGMRVGGRRRITIPPNMAYGKRGAGGVIGPDETLVFVVDLMGVRQRPKRPVSVPRAMAWSERAARTSSGELFLSSGSRASLV